MACRCHALWLKLPLSLWDSLAAFGTCHPGAASIPSECEPKLLTGAWASDLRATLLQRRALANTAMHGPQPCPTQTTHALSHCADAQAEMHGLLRSRPWLSHPLVWQGQCGPSPAGTPNLCFPDIAERLT